MTDEDVRVGLKKDILEYFKIISSPIGLDKLPMNLLNDLHEVMKKASIWAKAYNADELQD